MPELLHPPLALAGGSIKSGLSGLVRDSMDCHVQQPPQQARLCSLAAGALSSAEPAACIGKRLLAARKDRQKALEQYLALKVPTLPPTQLPPIPAPDEVYVTVTRPEQQQQLWPASQQQTAPVPALVPAAAAEAGAEPQQAAAALQQANTLAAAAAAAACEPSVNAAAEAATVAGVSARQVALMKLAATAEGRALLDNLRALQLLPAELPAGAHPAVDAAGAAQAVSRVREQQCNALRNDSAAAATMTLDPMTTTGTAELGQQQLGSVAAAAADALRHGKTYVVGSKRPISAVLPGEALSAAIAAAKRVLHNPPPWRGQAAQ
jgi:hypothetical protein